MCQTIITLSVAKTRVNCENQVICFVCIVVVCNVCGCSKVAQNTLVTYDQSTIGAQ